MNAATAAAATAAAATTAGVVIGPDHVKSLTERELGGRGERVDAEKMSV